MPSSTTTLDLITARDLAVTSCSCSSLCAQMAVVREAVSWILLLAPRLLQRNSQGAGRDLLW